MNLTEEDFAAHPGLYLSVYKNYVCGSTERPLDYLLMSFLGSPTKRGGKFTREIRRDFRSFAGPV